MKTIKFIKDHPAGIHTGKTVTRPDAFCDRMIAEEYAEEVPEASTEVEQTVISSQNDVTVAEETQQPVKDKEEKPDGSDKQKRKTKATKK